MERVSIFIHRYIYILATFIPTSAEEASICQLHLTEDLLITLIFQRGYEYFYTLLSNLNYLLSVKLNFFLKFDFRERICLVS